MKGLVLQGGGAKGAFQAGAVRALFERGYTFDGVVGTSIGALNALMIAQGDFELLYSLWENMAIDKVLDIDLQKWNKIKEKDFDKDTIEYLKDLIVDFFKKGGLDSTKAKALIDKYASEEKLRNSSMDYGLVTVKRKGELSFEAMIMFKEDIPEGMLSDYVMASANFPLFTKHMIGDSRYYDGGLYDNLPINMLLEKGYDSIVAIRLGDTIAPVKKPYLDEVEILYIDPSDDIGSVLDFDANNIKRVLKAGYYDAVRRLDGLDGKKYCIEYINEDEFDLMMLKLSNNFYENCMTVFEYEKTDNKLEKYLYICKRLAGLFRLDKRKEAWLTLIEVFAEYAGIDKYKIYSIQTLAECLINKCRNGYSFDADIKRKFLRQNTKEIKAMHILNALLQELSDNEAAYQNEKE